MAMMEQMDLIGITLSSGVDGAALKEANRILRSAGWKALRRWVKQGPKGVRTREGR